MVKKKSSSKVGPSISDRILADKKFLPGVQDYAIHSILERNPQLQKNESYIEKNIDQSRLYEGIKRLSESDFMKANFKTFDEKKEYFRKGLADYISTGGAFNDRAKEVILRKSALEEKAGSGFLKGFFARRTLKGEKYLENTVEAFQDLYSLLKTGDYAERMPEFEKAAKTINDMGFLSPAVDILKSYNLINGPKYFLLKRSIRKATEESVQNTIGGIEKYITQKAAAIVVGLIGALMVFTSVNMTGGVIGALGSNSIKIIGAILFFVALIVFLKISKISKKKNSKIIKIKKRKKK